MANQRVLTHVCLVVLMIGGQYALAQGPLSTAFTYQGQLKQYGARVTDTADFRFVLFDAYTGGSQVSSILDVYGVDVVDGLFVVELEFDVSVFDGDARWLQVGVRVPTGGGTYTWLAPRQPLTAVPYATQTRGLYVDDTLNVGVGTTDPQTKLHVADGDTRLDGELYMYGDIDEIMASHTFSQGVWFDTINAVTGSAVYAWGTSNADGAGVLHLRSREGYMGVEIDGDGDDADNGITAGAIEVRSYGTGGLGGQVAVQNNDGSTRVRMAGGESSDGGTIEMFNDIGNRTILLDGEATTGSDLQMFNDDGILTIDIDSENSDAGQIGVTNGVSASYRIELDGDGAADDGGEIEVFAADSSTTIHIDAQETDNAGAIEVRNDVSSTRVYIDGMDFGGGRIDVRQDDSTNGIVLRGEEFDGGENGSVFEMFAEDGAEVLEIDSGFASGNGVAFWIDGHYTATGSKSAAVTLDSGQQRLMYCTEATELWFEEVGSGQLRNGVAEIVLDPLYRQTVTISEQHPMRVMVTLTDNCNGVYVKKSGDRFTVHELMGGTSDATFDYKVICKRKGYESQRMAIFTRPAADGPNPPADHSMHIPTEGLGDPYDGAQAEPGEEQNVVPTQRQVPPAGRRNQELQVGADGRALKR